MKKKLQLFALSLLLIAYSYKVSAQTYTIHGVVADSNAHALPDAVISIYRNSDSVVVQRFKSDKQGIFLSNDLKSSESYLLSVEYLGYDTYFQNLNKGVKDSIL